METLSNWHACLFMKGKRFEWRCFCRMCVKKKTEFCLKNGLCVDNKDICT